MVTEMAGFQSSYPVTGQTYPRLVDTKITAALAMFGSAAHKVGFIFYKKIQRDQFQE